jgi:hypothetical protein
MPRSIHRPMRTRSSTELWWHATASLPPSGKKRVLRNDLSYRDKTLLLLHHDADSAMAVEDLISWTDHSNPTVFKRDVLRPLHQKRHVEYDTDHWPAYSSPSTHLQFLETECKSVVKC